MQVIVNYILASFLAALRQTPVSAKSAPWPARSASIAGMTTGTDPEAQAGRAHGIAADDAGARYTVTVAYRVEAGPHRSAKIARRRALRAAGLAAEYLGTRRHVLAVDEATVTDDAGTIRPVRLPNADTA